MSKPGKFSILVVCMGNICRSPTAHAVLEHKLEAAGLAEWVLVASAGTHAWHTGKAPDLRAAEHAERRGYDLSHLRARAVTDTDFTDFDLILAMDEDNLAHLSDRCPPQHQAKLGLLSGHALRLGTHRIVPDPYYGGPNGFELVLDLVEDACEGVVRHLRNSLRLPPGGNSGHSD